MKNIFIITMLLLVALQPLRAQDTTALDNMYDMDIEELMNLVVETATKTEQTVEEAPAIVTVITSNDIKNMGARELIDVLQFVPGFEVARKNTGEVLIGVRGVKDPRFACKLLLLEDGRPMNGIFYGDAILPGYGYDLENIDRIEIIRGPGSALYGRNAFSAVINMITKNGITGKGLSVQAEAGSFNHFSGRLNYGYAKNGLDFRISAYGVKTDGSDAFLPDMENNPTENRWTVDQNNQIINAEIGYKGFTSKFTYANQKLGSWDRGIEIRRKRFHYLFGYERELSDKVNFTAKLYGQLMHHVEDYQLLKPDPATVAQGLFIAPEFKDFMYGGEVEVNINLFEGNDLFIGIQGDYRGSKDAIITSNFDLATGIPYSDEGHDNQIEFEGGWVDEGGHDYTNFAVYIQDIYYPIKKIGITVGARYDVESQIGGMFNPRLGVVWNVMPKTYFKLLYGSAYRSPAGSQQYQLSGFATGYEDLKPERIQTFEASLSYRMKKMITQVNVFRNDITDMIYAEKYITSNVLATPPNRNMGENIAMGIEIENKIYFTKYINTFLNYSYTMSENTDDFSDGTSQTYDHIDVAPHKLNAGINFTFRKFFNFSTNIKYRSEMAKFFTYNEENEKVEVSKNSVGDYAIVNCTFRIAPGLLKGLEFSASAYNVFDTKYYSQESSLTYAPEQGNRQFIFKLGYIFN